MTGVQGEKGWEFSGADIEKLQGGFQIPRYVLRASDFKIRVVFVCYFP